MDDSVEQFCGTCIWFKYINRDKHSVGECNYDLYPTSLSYRPTKNDLMFSYNGSDCQCWKPLDHD